MRYKTFWQLQSGNFLIRKLTISKTSAKINIYVLVFYRHTFSYFDWILNISKQIKCENQKYKNLAIFDVIFILNTMKHEPEKHQKNKKKSFEYSELK